MDNYNSNSEPITQTRLEAIFPVMFAHYRGPALSHPRPPNRAVANPRHFPKPTSGRNNSAAPGIPPGTARHRQSRTRPRRLC